MNPSKITRINFLNYPVDSLNINDALVWMEIAISNRAPQTITVTNANKLFQVSKNARLAKILRGSSLVLPEYAVYWGAAWLGTPLKDFVCGIELFKASLPWAEKKGYRPFFLGAKPEIINALGERLKKEFPSLKIAGMHHGYIKTESDNQRVCSEIQQSRADVLFVAMGSPRQEYWIEENSARIGVPVSMGVGGSFDVIAGLKSDTPDWARGHGIEWIYRLCQEPKAYWRRYLITNPWFVYQIWKAKILSFQRAVSSS